MISDAEPDLRGRSHPLGKVGVLVRLSARRTSRGFEVIAQAPHQCRMGRRSDVERLLDCSRRQAEFCCERRGIEVGEVEIRAQLRAVTRRWCSFRDMVVVSFVAGRSVT